MLQDAHALDLAGSTVDVELPELLGVCLPGKKKEKNRRHTTVRVVSQFALVALLVSNTKGEELHPHLERKHVVREHDNFVAAILMILDQKLTGLEFARIHAVQQILLS